MKTPFLNILFLFLSTVSICQITPNTQPIQFEYKPLGLDRFQAPLAQKQAKYDQNYEYLHNLLNWVSTLKNTNSDLIFQSKMNEYNQTLKTYEKWDLSKLSSELKGVEMGISEQINQYNIRIQEKNNTNTYWSKGNDAFQKKDYRTAINEYNEVIRLSPNFWSAYGQRGHCYFKLKNWSLAIADLTTKINNDNTDYFSFLERGWCFNNLGRNIEAKNDMNKCIELRPDIANNFYSRGSVLSDLKEYDKAIEDYKSAIKLEPTFSMAYNNIAWVKFLQGKYKEGLIYSDQAIKFDSKNYVAIDTRAEIKFNLNDFAGCISDANLALSLKTDLTNSLYLKGRALYKLGKKKEACIEWKKASDLGHLESLELAASLCIN